MVAHGLARALLLLATFIFVPGVSAARAPTPEPLLAERADISMADLRSLGEDIIAKEIEVKKRSQGLAVIGVMRLNVTPDAVHRALATIDQESVGPEESSIKALNLIPQPAGADEFASYEFSKTEKKALESCELGSCRVKLTAELIEQVAQLDYDWEQHADAFTSAYRASLNEYEQFVAYGAGCLAVFSTFERLSVLSI